MSTSIKKRLTIPELRKLQFPRNLGFFLRDATGTLYSSKRRFKVGERILLAVGIWQVNKVTRNNQMYTFEISLAYQLSSREWEAVWDNIHVRKRKGKGT